jgi:hypothetical protein
MRSWPLILENKCQSFIGAKDKSLSCFATKKGGTKVVLQAEQCWAVFLG